MAAIPVNFSPAVMATIQRLSCGAKLAAEDVALLRPFLECNVETWINIKVEFTRCFPPKDDAFQEAASKQAAPPAFLFYVAFRILNDWSSFSPQCCNGKIPPTSE